MNQHTINTQKAQAVHRVDMQTALSSAVWAQAARTSAGFPSSTEALKKQRALCRGTALDPTASLTGGLQEVDKLSHLLVPLTRLSTRLTFATLAAAEVTTLGGVLASPESARLEAPLPSARAAKARKYF